MTYTMPVKAMDAPSRRNGTGSLGGGLASCVIAILTVAGCSAASDDGRTAAPESTAPSTTGAAPGGGDPVGACVKPQGPLAAEASLVGRAGEYLLTMIEEVDGGLPARPKDHSPSSHKKSPSDNSQEARAASFQG